jgi:glycine cleavage system H protein
MKYTATHEWVRVEGDIATVGITDHAVEQLNDLVFIDLPEAGASTQKGGRFGEIESTKAVSDLVSPVSGEIVEVNSGVVDELQRISDSPFEGGWLIRVRMSDPTELEALLGSEEYATQLEAEEA